MSLLSGKCAGWHPQRGGLKGEKGSSCGGAGSSEERSFLFSESPAGVVYPASPKSGYIIAGD
jgi:hypothetical protein